MYIEEATFTAGRRTECLSTNTSEHKRGGDGYRTRCEHGDKDVRKEDEGGVRNEGANEETQQEILSEERPTLREVLTNISLTMP